MLRPVPAGVSVGATRTLELGGAKRGGGGGGKRREAVVQHSVLGSLEEYTAQVADHGLVSRDSEGGRGEGRGGVICLLICVWCSSLRVCLHQFTQHQCPHLPTSHPHTPSLTETPLWYTYSVHMCTQYIHVSIYCMPGFQQPRETHALRYWSEAMEDRKHQQNYLAGQCTSSLSI